MHARLVDDDVRKLRQAVLDVLDLAAARDLRGIARIRLPERRFVDPVRLARELFAEAEGLRHLHGSTGDAVGLPDEQRAVLQVSDGEADVRKRGELRGQHQAGGAASDDEHVQLFGDPVAAPRLRQRLVAIGIAGPEAVQEKLHGQLLSFDTVAGNATSGRCVLGPMVPLKDRDLVQARYLASTFIARSSPESVVGYMRPFISSLRTWIDWR